MLFWLLGRQEWLCWYYKSKMGLRQAVAPPYLTVFHTRRNVVRRKALEILWVFLIEQAKQGQDGSAAAHNDSWSAVRVRRIFLNFPTFSPIRMNSMTCWNVYSNLNGSIKMRAQETWPLQWSANPPTDQLSLTCSLKANRQVRAPPRQCAHNLPIWNKLWRGLSYSNYGMIKRNLILLLLEGSSCTFKTKWCALQWRFSANAVLLFFTVNIGLKYDTPLKKGRVKWKFPL